MNDEYLFDLIGVTILISQDLLETLENPVSVLYFSCRIIYLYIYVDSPLCC